MPEEQKDSGAKTVMRWLCGVPVLANPFILIDVFLSTAVVWLITVLLVIAAQVLLGEGPLIAAHFAAACVLASYASALLLVVYFAVCLLFYRGGYVMLFRLEENGLFMVSMRGSGSESRVFCVRPFPADETAPSRHSVERSVAWTDVRSVEEISNMRTLVLKGRFGTLARLYCPDEKTYREAFSLVKRKTAVFGQI